MADSNENILVEFDYNNISVIDPNKVIDENGRAKERLVKHEELVMYANLECKVIPRTKLVIGASNSDNLRTISVASMNFLNPGEKTYLDNEYTNELTGRDTLKGEGVNQKKIDKLTTPNKTNEFFYNQSTKSNKEPKATDNGLLGIKSISIKQGTDFEPVINIKLEDVKGRALFESGNDSPYAAFFNLPYPLFYLTIKGFYGKAVRYPLMLQDFNSSYDSNTGNFTIDLVLYTYKFSVISEISLASLIATPHMYKSNVKITPKTVEGGIVGNQPNSQTRTEVVEYGTQKIKEVYSEYKSKGLIPNDFPEITVVQMQKRLDQFIQKVLDSFSQQNLDPLTNLSRFADKLLEYQQDVFLLRESWFNRYMDTENFYVLKKELTGDSTKVYTFRPDFGNVVGKPDYANVSESAISELKSLIQYYNEILNNNDTCGVNGNDGKGGSYEIGGDIIPCQIKNGVEYKIFELPAELTSDDIDFVETYKKRKGDKIPTEQELNELAVEFNKFNKNQATKTQTKEGEEEKVFFYFKFEGKKSFMDVTNQMFKDKKTKEDEIETALTEALAKQIKSKDSVLGFVPTIRNVLAVIFANGEAFLRLLDEVHSNAWKERNNAVRKAPIFSVGANPDATRQGDNAKVPIYPWPEFIKETSGEKGIEKFETKYPGAPDVINETKAFLYEFWPEVEFVEEYTRGLTEKVAEIDTFPSNNEVKDSKRVSINALEYPTNNEIYNNKEEVKFFFEIYERVLLDAFFSKMSRTTTNKLELEKISEVAAEIENVNILQSLAVQSPFIYDKLKNYGLNSANFLSVLQQFSNQGVGESWQNYIRGIFNTPYIKNLVKNDSFKILGLNQLVNVLGQEVNNSDVSAAVSIPNETDIVEYITGSTNSKQFDFSDTYPFIDLNWNRKYMAGKNPVPPSVAAALNIPSPPVPITEFNDTSLNLLYNVNYKVISNFNDATLSNSLTENTPKPYSSYNFKSLKTTGNGSQNVSKPELNTSNLNDFYEKRSANYNAQFPTEGNLNYENKIGLLTKYQTVSILNTPYFINAIQDGIQRFRNFDEFPYVNAAYLFLNSLPISTLREKYTKFSSVQNSNSNQTQDSIEYMNYIFATLRKYGAVHKLPYAWVLKIGSIWHRYKVWAETGTDILDSVWTSFDVLGNFDPTTSAFTKDYSLTLSDNSNVDIILTKDTTIGTQKFTQMSTGFYPKTINDFNVFYQGYRLFTGFTSTDIQSGITSGLTIINSSSANIIINFSGDPANPNNALQLNAWTTYVLTPDKLNCYILPSHGANFNQAYSECFKDDKKKVTVAYNDSIYNGSVRLFWNAPNYGYFYTFNSVKPRPDEYMKKVFGGFQSQENFSINYSQNKYSKISEIFSVFDKQILDQFEQKFLSFCRPKYNYVDVDVTATEAQKTYGNFQILLSNLMKVAAPPTGVTASEVIDFIQKEQINNFSTTINGFLTFDVLVKHGNPSFFDRKLFYTFSNKLIQDPYIFEKYSVVTPNALPATGNTQTLINSRITYPDAWKELITYVGFTEVENIEYTDTGSTIFDFFIDFDIAFKPENVRVCAPIIKIYATQKFLKNGLTSNDFSTLMDAYIDKNIEFVNKSLDSVFTKLQKGLSSITIEKDRNIPDLLQGSQTKLELYGAFKALNDKWIAGNDYKSKTLFEDILLLDRASRNIGDIVVVDIYALRDFLDPKLLNTKQPMYFLVQSILKMNNFQTMNIPAFVNYYNVQDATKNPVPKPEGSLELANTLFGTFMDVDYRDSSSKMVCFYAGKPSVQLDTSGFNQGYSNDSFDLRRASDNPLIENQVNKRDWDKSNKVVGFNIDFGPQNQGIFQTFNVSQKNSTATAESLQLLSEMSRQAGNRSSAVQNLSLYNLYKIRSYDCNVTMMGNALIQPMMYFNLRYVPMFSGPYMILEVTHQISPGAFNTSFTGIRQPIAGLPINLDFIQSLRTNLVQKIVEKNKQKTSRQKAQEDSNSIANKNSIENNSLGTNQTSNDSECSANTVYNTFSNEIKYSKLTDKETISSVTAKQVKLAINNLALGAGITSQDTILKLSYAIFAQMYLQGGNKNTNDFTGIENNYIGIDMKTNWGKENSERYFSTKRQYFCVKRNDNILPYVVFDSLESNINFLISRWRYRVSQISTINPDNIALFVNTNLKPISSSPNNWYTLDPTTRQNIVQKVDESMKIYDATI